MVHLLIIIGSIFIFLFGSLLHFLYKWTGSKKIVSIIASTNESIFEHTKLLILPYIVWLVFIYIIKKEEFNINLDKYAFASFISILTSVLMITILYATYIRVFFKNKKGYFVIDILIFLIASLIGLYVGYHFYLYFTPFKYYYSLILIFIVIILNIIFSFYPLDIPYFIDETKR